MNALLTAAITFKNEGEELLRTVRGIRETCGDGVDIHLINDGSDDDYDYQKIASDFLCRYTAFEESRGPAANRNLGVDCAETEHVILLDAHMRFYAKDWHLKVIAAIEQDPDALYSTVSRPLYATGEIDNPTLGYGAQLLLDENIPEKFMVAGWNTKPLDHADYPMIPCILGATYAFRKSFFQRIGGYVGLQMFGGEEAFISIKAWLMGGRCRLIRDVEIGHVYRASADEVPWSNTESYFYYNRLLLLAVLFPKFDFERYASVFAGIGDFENARKQLDEKADLILNLREYLQERLVYSIDYFLRLNDAFAFCQNLEACFDGSLRQQPTLSIVIPTWNKSAYTRACLMSLKECTEADFEIVWVDNGSTEDEHEAVLQDIRGLDFTCIRSSKPLGFAKAVNQGLAQAEGRYIVLLNSDVVVTSGWDKELREAVDLRPGISGPVSVNSIGWQSSSLHAWLSIPGDIGSNDIFAAYWLRQNWHGQSLDVMEEQARPYFRDMLAFFCVMMPKEIVDEIGLLDERFGWGFCEDDDYCRRALAAGYSLSLCPGAAVFHEAGVTQRQIGDIPNERWLENDEKLKAKWQNEMAG